MIASLACLRVAALLLCAATAGAKDSAPLGDAFDANNWAAVGRTAGETHYSPLTEINRETVGQAQAGVDVRSRPRQRPGNSARGDGIIYVAAGYSIVYAVDALTGKSLWRFDPEVLLVAGKKLRAGSGVRGVLHERVGCSLVRTTAD